MDIIMDLEVPSLSTRGTFQNRAKTLRQIFVVNIFCTFAIQTQNYVSVCVASVHKKRL